MVYEFEGKTEQDAIARAAAELGLGVDQFDVEILEIQKSSLFKKGFARIRVHVAAVTASPGHAAHAQYDPVSVLSEQQFADLGAQLRAFLSHVFHAMGYAVTIDAFVRESDRVVVRLHSSHSAILIGKKGKNLDALQLLANVFFTKIGVKGVKVVLDCENYRIRREEMLIRMAYATADQVSASKRSVLLEPMNPYERRLIHTTLHGISGVETRSEGEGLYKQVRVCHTGGAI